MSYIFEINHILIINIQYPLYYKKQEPLFDIYSVIKKHVEAYFFCLELKLSTYTIFHILDV